MAAHKAIALHKTVERTESFTKPRYVVKTYSSFMSKMDKGPE